LHQRAESQANKDAYETMPLSVVENPMKTRAAIVAGLLSASVAIASAETSEEHSAHHPNAASEPAPPQMGGNSMMGNGMSMMGMMQTMMGSGGMGGMATIDRVEGRIAFLKTELKITDGQGDAWNVFADVLRSNARKLGELRASMAPQASLVDRLTWQEKWLTARSENTRAIRTAYTDLAAKFTDDQKKSAEQLLAPHMGMMATMSGMGSGQMMGGTGMGQMDNMGSSQMPMMPGSPMTTGKMPLSK
jgi:hypothetical protein